MRSKSVPSRPRCLTKSKATGNAAAEQRGPDLRQHDAPERREAAGPQTAGDLVQGAVRTAQRGGDGQVDQRIEAERHHQHRAAEPVHGRAQRRPRVAGDEVGDGQRQQHEDPPHPTPRQPGAFHAPGRPQRDQGRAGGDGEGQLNRVDQQRQGQPAQQQPADQGPSDARRLPDQEGHGEDQGHADQCGQAGEQPWRPARYHPCRAGRLRFAARGTAAGGQIVQTRRGGERGAVHGLHAQLRSVSRAALAAAD